MNLSNPLTTTEFCENIGWTLRVVCKLLGADRASQDNIFEGKVAGISASLFVITHEAARRVLSNVGRSEDQIEATLSDRTVYLFELNANSSSGQPFLVTESNEKGLMVTAAVHNNSDFSRNVSVSVFNYYFAVEKTIRVFGQLGRIENYHTIPVEVFHPLRAKNEENLRDLESEWRQAKANEEGARAGTPQRKMAREESVNAGLTLKQYYDDIVAPFLSEPFQDTPAE